MPSTKAYKILGQALPAAGALSSLYDVPVGKQVVCSTLVVCNQNNGQPAAFRIAVIPAGQSVSRASYLFYDELIDINKSRLITIGITLQPGDAIKVFASIPDLSFNVFGSEFAV